MNYRPLVLLLLCSLSLPAKAQQNAAAPPQNGEPIEIEASKSVEWLRGQNQYVARENVVVTQGKMTINSDLLTADYRDNNGATEIWQLTAEGNVQIKDENNTAYGDKGVYDVPGGIAVLTGQNLRLVSPEQTVTARDRMEYHSATREAKAIGDAKVVRAQDTLSADTISAFFKDNAAAATPAAPASEAPQKSTAGPLGGNSSSLDRLEAEGNVVIKTPTETLYGQRAIYRAASNTAELMGKVRVERGQNTLEGSRAEVNLATNVSKMFGSEKGGRVRGIFFPGSEKAGDKKNTASAAPVPSALPTVAPKAIPNVPVPPAPAVIFTPTPVAPPADGGGSPPPTPVAAPPAIQAPPQPAASAPASPAAPEMFPAQNPSQPPPAPATVSRRIDY